MNSVIKQFGSVPTYHHDTICLGRSGRQCLRGSSLPSTTPIASMGTKFSPELKDRITLSNDTETNPGPYTECYQSHNIRGLEEYKNLKEYLTWSTSLINMMLESCAYKKLTLKMTSNCNICGEVNM